MVSQSSATNCIVRASSKMRSISVVTSVRFEAVRLFDLSMSPCRLPPIGFDCSARRAKLISDVTRVMMIRFAKRCFIKSKIAFCIISVTSKPFSDGPINITGLIEGTTSYGGRCSSFLKNFFLSLPETPKLMADLLARPPASLSSSSRPFDLPVCACCRRRFSSLMGDGMNPISQPSLTRRPIHQSLLYFSLMWRKSLMLKEMAKPCTGLSSSMLAS